MDDVVRVALINALVSKEGLKAFAAAGVNRADALEFIRTCPQIDVLLEAHVSRSYFLGSRKGVIDRTTDERFTAEDKLRILAQKYVADIVQLAIRKETSIMSYNDSIMSNYDAYNQMLDGPTAAKVPASTAPLLQSGGQYQDMTYDEYMTGMARALANKRCTTLGNLQCDVITQKMTRSATKHMVASPDTMSSASKMGFDELVMSPSKWTDNPRGIYAPECKSLVARQTIPTGIAALSKYAESLKF